MATLIARSLLVLALHIPVGCVVDRAVFQLQGDGGLDASLLDAQPVDASTPDAALDAGMTVRGVSKVVARDVNTVVLRGGQLLGAGDNRSDQLGRNDVAETESFIAVGTDSDWVDVTGGREFYCAMKATGDVYCWGDNQFGQLGTGDFNNRLRATQVSLPPARVVAARHRHVCAILTNGTLWCWGDNGESQLGRSTNEMDQPLPIQVGVETDWLTVSPGHGHTCGIRAPGRLWCWGRNSQGQGGQDPGAGQQLVTPTQVVGATSWAQVASGQSYSCGLDTLGKLYCWGVNASGQLGIDGVSETFTPSRVGIDEDWIGVAVDTFSTCGLHTGGRLECWGRSIEGQLGLPGIEPRTQPTAVMTASTATPMGLSLGRFHSCLVDVDGLVACAGANEDGRLGVGDQQRRNRFTPGLSP